MHQNLFIAKLQISFDIIQNSIQYSLNERIKMNCEYAIAEFLFFAHDVYNQEQERQRKERDASNKGDHSFVYYFAYGALMNQTYLEEKIGAVEFIGKAALQGFQLSFAKLPLPCRQVKATILPNYQTFIEGAVYKINCLQLELLDKGKETNTFCRRIRLHATPDNSLPIPVELHMFDFKIGIHYQSPNAFYYAKMLEGAENIGISQQYKQILLQHKPFAQNFKSKL